MGIVNLYLSLVYVSLLGPNINRKLLERTEAASKETGEKVRTLRDEVCYSQPGLEKHTEKARSRLSGWHPWHLLWGKKELGSQSQGLLGEGSYQQRGPSLKERGTGQLPWGGLGVKEEPEGWREVRTGTRVKSVAPTPAGLCPSDLLLPAPALFLKAEGQAFISEGRKLRPWEFK